MQNGTNGASGDPQSFFEEFVGELFDKLGYTIESHPPVGKGFAVYLAITPGGERFYIEASAVRPTQLSEARPTENDVCRKLDETCKTPYVYWFTATASGELYQYLSKKSLDPIKRWIEGLNSEDPSPQSAHFEFPSGAPPKGEGVPSKEWKIKIHARPRSKTKRESQIDCWQALDAAVVLIRDLYTVLPSGVPTSGLLQPVRLWLARGYKSLDDVLEGVGNRRDFLLHGSATGSLLVSHLDAPF